VGLANHGSLAPSYPCLSSSYPQATFNTIRPSRPWLHFQYCMWYAITNVAFFDEMRGCETLERALA
jgi:hypothetical protein